MESKIVINFEYLNAIKYGELEKKLNELGVADSWVGGKKKVEIINDAISKLAKLKQLKENGVADEDAQKELDLLAAEEEKQAEQALIESQEKEKSDALSALEEVVEQKFTRAQVENSLRLIDVNLKNNVKGQRDTLMRKRKALQDMLLTME
jgi:ERCC4-related helicase